MPQILAELTQAEFEALIRRTVDERLSVWLTQLMDALTGTDEEDRVGFSPEFAESLSRSIDQAGAGELISLESLRQSPGE